MEEPIVSIVIPTYKRSNYLKEALDKLEFPMIDWEKLKNRPTDMPKKREYHRSKIRK